METLDIVLEKGCMLYVPSFWWYSIKFEQDSLISSCQYSSLMNCIYNIPSWALHYIQETSMEDRLTNLKGYLSTSKPDKEVHAIEPTIVTKEDVPSEETKQTDPEIKNSENAEKVEKVEKVEKKNDINVEKEIKDTLDSITTTIEGKHDV